MTRRCIRLGGSELSLCADFCLQASVRFGSLGRGDLARWERGLGVRVLGPFVLPGRVLALMLRAHAALVEGWGLRVPCVLAFLGFDQARRGGKTWWQDVVTIVGNSLPMCWGCEGSRVKALTVAGAFLSLLMNSYFGDLSMISPITTVPASSAMLQLSENSLHTRTVPPITMIGIQI